MTGAGRRNETIVFVAALLTATSLVGVGGADAATQTLVLAACVALLGIPHGALDLRLARALWPLPRARGLALFALGYLGVAAAILVLWQLAPGVALAAFLVYSALHFGGDWRAELSVVQRPIAGTLVVSLPTVLWPGEVRAVFAVLAPAEAAQLLTSGLRLAALLAGPALLASWAIERRPMRRAPWELGGLLVAALVLPPLIYFIVYFCFLHSPRHFIDSVAALGLGVLEGARAAMPLTLATWAMAGIAFVLFLDAGMTVGSATLEVVFVGLAALAVPHMVLVERFWVHGR